MPTEAIGIDLLLVTSTEEEPASGCFVFFLGVLVAPRLSVAMKTAAKCGHRNSRIIRIMLIHCGHHSVRLLGVLQLVSLVSQHPSVGVIYVGE
jgi:hypothetical protein